jgi:hypothetical protein
MAFQAWPLWVSVIGVMIEFVGFAILGSELIQTNSRSLEEAKKLATETSLFTSLYIDEGHYSDPSSGSAKVEGGILGRLIDSIPTKEKEAARSRFLILVGLGISGFGVFLQIAGALGQAVCN